MLNNPAFVFKLVITHTFVIRGYVRIKAIQVLRGGNFTFKYTEIDTKKQR